MQTGDHRMAVRHREDLILGESGKEQVRLASALDSKLRKLFGRSLRLRQVSAGGCGACEADTNVLGTIGWDLGRFGIQFVASPRHADGLLVTGCVSKNMELALKKAWDAVPEPKIVIAVGACAIAGGPFVGHPQILNGANSVVPVDLYIPGCPPHPLTILDGLLRLLDRLQENTDTSPSREDSEVAGMKRRRILIADNNPIFLNAACHFFDSLGHLPDQATRGVVALDLVNKQ
jgi:Ni,Fe-hydrogenase III small subunit